jgi:hypothetical protein
MYDSNSQNSFYNEIFQTEVAEKIKTHITYSKLFCKNRAVCEIMGKNMVEPDRQQMTKYETCALHAG